MKQTMGNHISKFLQQATLLVTGSALAVSAAYGQGGGPGGNSGQCSVTQIRMRIGTGGDDLRGGDDNLNVTIHFRDGSFQGASNVNQNANWPNNSVHVVVIPLNHTVAPKEIRSFTLDHLAKGGLTVSGATIFSPVGILAGLKTADNWDMSYLRASAIGNGVGARIATYGFYRFTGSNPVLNIRASVPRNVCGTGRPTGNSGGTGSGVLNPGINPGGSGLHSVTGGSGSGGPGSTSAGTNRKFQPLLPRGQSNSGSGGALSSFQPLIQRGSANTGPGSGTGAQQLRKLNPPARMVMRPLTAKMRAKLGPPKKGQPIQNPRALQTSAAITLVLQRQRQGADAEASRMMKLGIRPQGQAGMLGQQSQLMSANGNRAALPAAQTQPKAINGGTTTGSGTQPQANRAMLTAPATVQMAPRTGSVGNIGPSHTENANGNAGGSPTLRPGSNVSQGASGNALNGTSSGAKGFSSSMVGVGLGPGESLVLFCAQSPGMRIVSVSGSSSFAATFTPAAQYNFYTITGCSFGNIGPNAKVYIYKGATLHEEFQIQEWNDNWIKLNLDPNLTGVLDQDNLTLVVQRADGQQTTEGGFKFYAAREKKLLSQIPSSYFGLYGLTLADTSKWSQSYESPIPTTDDWGYGFGGMTAEVAISEGLPFIYDNDFETPQTTPSPGTDIFDLSHLQPGFSPTEADFSWQDMDCSPGGGTLVTSGNFSGEFNGAQLWINFPGENCSHMSKPGFLTTDYFGGHGLVYGLDVFVEGPRGVDPWTGLPTNH
ncbi:MAG TPA: hypothetical protein VGR84_19280 [Candidatus Acidoferrales bacterium]|nr:hypothetical protein [Candidatus Acidoferrales bacterium]